MTAQSKFVEANGVKLHYLEWASDGPPLVTTHGTGMMGAAWMPVAQYLAPHYRVIALDMRGHGDSEKPDWGYTWGTLGKDFACFLEALDLQRALVVGHSRGGSCVIMGAQQCAQRLAGVMLIEPSILMRRPEEIGASTAGPRSLEMAEQARRRRAVFSSREEAFDSYRDRGMFKGWPDENLRLYLQHALADRTDGQVELKCPPEIEARFYTAPVETDVREAAGHFRCPIMLVWGQSAERFNPTLPLVAEFISMTNCQTAQLPGGHFMIMQHPKAVAQLILEFGRSIGLAE
ncbi:MAG: alpha/beta hydrolase [Chloroflexota bacterium]|nr:alpha/beta hydrolase [Chloroflexota bacterium]